jgi:sialic acid synthase SpsE
MKLILDACNNHLGSWAIIKEMIDIASTYRNTLIKFQLFNPYELNKDFPDFDSRLEEYEACQIDYILLEEIFNQCYEKNITPVFTIFCKSRIKDLVPYLKQDFIIKIASPDCNNYDLIDEIKSQLPDKQLIISTGMSTKEDILECKCRYPDAKFLYCKSKYPHKIQDLDLGYMLEFNGLSDHSNPNDNNALHYAIMHGFELYERHFTLSRSLPTRDRGVSIDPEELWSIKQDIDFEDTRILYRNRWNDD